MTFHLVVSFLFIYYNLIFGCSKIFISMKMLIKQLLREGLTENLNYEIEHLGSVYGQNNYELGLYLNGEILGLVQYTIFQNELTISNIVVRPEYRRKGFGSKMMQYIKQNHPDAKYKPSVKTDLGVKFKHKNHDDLYSVTEEELEHETKTAVIEILIPIAYMDLKNYYQTVPYHSIETGRVFIKKGSAGSKSISTKNIKVLKIFKSNETEEINDYLNQLRNNAL